MSMIYYIDNLLLIGANDIFGNLIFVFMALLVILFILIITYSFYARIRDKNKKHWEEGIGAMINEAIFSDGEIEFVIPDNITEKLLKKTHYRQCCTNAIIEAKKALLGSSALNLKKLYEQLNLDKDSFQKLSSYNWQKKAKGIQELSEMDQVNYVKNIYRLTTNKNETVRNEAQCGLVKYYGFSGLRFLNVTVHPISEWQQIQLINKLGADKADNTNMLIRWLRSDMESITLFSLKLACFYSNYEVYNVVLQCLKHSNLKIKLLALEYLQKMADDDTAELILKEYTTGEKAFRLAVINAVKNIGNEKQLTFLIDQLNDSDDDVKAAAANALSSIHPSGKDLLKKHSYADSSPWNNILHQAINELAA